MVEVDQQKTANESFHTEEMIISMGPQHPSTHGVLRFELSTDGEVLRSVKVDIGYLHRGMEKIAEKVGYTGFMPYTDRIDYLAAMSTNQGYAMVVEKLAGIAVPERAEYLRVLAVELCRIGSHLIGLGSLNNDVGASTPFVHAIRERETINDLLESLCGARLTYNYMRIGGVSYDLPEGFIEKARIFLKHFVPIVDEYCRLIVDNKIFIERLANIAVISKEDAINYGLVGPSLRGSGVKFDVRKDDPYSVYPQIQFNIPVGTGRAGTLGDCFDRNDVRVQEMRESVHICDQCLDWLEKHPGESIQTTVPRKIKPPVGESYVRVESARGDMGFWLMSDGTENPYRLHFRTGSFTAMGIFEKMCPGLMIADLVALIGSFDIVAPEIDR